MTQQNLHTPLPADDPALMDALLYRWLLGQLQAVGLFVDARPVSEAATLEAVLPQYRRWMEETLAALARQGYLRREGQSWSAIEAGRVDVAAVRQTWEAHKSRWGTDRGKRSYVALLEAALEALPDILTGRTPATDILFPQGSTSRVEDIYRHNPVSDYFNGVLADILVEYVRRRVAHRPHERLRLLEIGAGTGGTSATLFKRLKPFERNLEEYRYTDVSKAFLSFAEKEFGPDVPYLACSLFDVERPPAEQGLLPGRYDVLVATNVLHATRNIRATLRNAKALLKQNGLIYVNEMISGGFYLHLTFGLLEGWWRYEDAELRIQGCPGLAPETWRQVLRQEGFRSVLFPAQPAHNLGQQIIVAESDGIVSVNATRAAASTVAPKPPATQAAVRRPASVEPQSERQREHPSSDELRPRVVEYFKRVIGETLKVPAEQIDAAELLSTYGLDSILVTQVSHRLSEALEGVSSTLFFEHQTIDALAGYFIAHQRAALVSLVGLEVAKDAPQPSAAPPLVRSGGALNTFSRRAPRRAAAVRPEAISDAAYAFDTAEPIAVIGLSGRYPGATNVEQYWQNLVLGRKSITEIPPGRWDWREHYHAETAEAPRLHKSYSKWGGFLEGVELFDPLFFNMSPRDAETIDPQELLFLQECWNALQDAGYAPSQLTPEVRQDAGVFAAITKQHQFPPTSFSSLANRVSYQLNLQGKSMPIDTMCSSSLVAVHEACEYLRRAGGRLALAGGVNLYLDPSKYVHLCASRFVADGGVCASFGAGGTGFVPGEGVAAVVLKRLADAERDGDYIYALIRGTAVNHGGRSNTYTSSNPAQQAAVIRKALEAGGTDPRAVNYIEAAANGLEMGDAIEMAALAKVFGEQRGAQGDYRVGSVKPNIGHSEAASGMSQLTKVLMSLRHKMLAPTLLPEKLSPHIAFDTLPFALQSEASPWRPLVFEGRTLPRTAGITGVGGGGVNAHIVVEEYLPAAPRRAVREPAEPLLFLLSARTPEQLKAYAEAWAAYLEQTPEVELASALYTLQTGREAMSSRLAVVTRDHDDLVAQLRQCVEREGSTETCFNGDIRRNQLKLEGAVAQMLEARQWKELAKLWVLGNTVPWERLYAGAPPTKAAGLPPYPFELRRVWTPPDLRAVEAPAAPQTPAQTEGQFLNKAEEFYSLSTRGASGDYREEYLTLCPFPEKIPGFSMTRMFIEPEQHPREFALMQSRQIELRQVLFCKEDLSKLGRVFDIGCGHGTDVIQLAAQYPHLRTEGYTITATQARLGNQRIAQTGLEARAAIYHRDSARNEFPAVYDLIIGIEVVCHIADKEGVFRNISAALGDDGRVLLMDFIANTRGRIAAPGIDIDIATQEGWAEVLAQHQLVIDELIDVSPQIANFLYDPDHEKNIEKLPEVARASFRNFANNYLSLEKGWVSYCLFKLRKETALSFEQRRAENERRIRQKTPYPTALEAMLRSGHIPYPRPERAAAEGQPQACVPPPAPASMPEVPARPAPRAGSTPARMLEEIFTSLLGLSPRELREAENFAELGISSINAVELTEAVNSTFALELPTSVVFEYPSMGALTSFVAGQLGGHAPLSERTPVALDERVDDKGPTTTSEESPGKKSAPRAANVVVPRVEPDVSARAGTQGYAIVGMSCRFPQAEGFEQYWRNVVSGAHFIEEVPVRRWSWREHYGDPRLASGKTTNRWGAFITGEDLFDPLFFGITPREAQVLEPELRLLLTYVWKAIEDAALTPASLAAARTGVFVATGPSDYPMLLSSAHGAAAPFKVVPSLIPNRISYALNLQGPSEYCETACSSALVAIHRAIQAMRGGECEQVIVGAVNLILSPVGHSNLELMGALNPDGRVNSFQAEAHGYVRGEGVGVVVLKPLADAVAQGDRIYAVVRGTGVGHGGHGQSPSAPHLEGMKEAVKRAYREACIAPETVGYIEAQGMASPLCDRTEVEAFDAAFADLEGGRVARASAARCVIGTLKPSIGHCEYVSGMASVIKAVLALRQQVRPGVAGFQSPSSALGLDPERFVIGGVNFDWPRPTDAEGNAQPRRAAVNSFGIGGVNAHLLLEEYETPSMPGAEVKPRPPFLVLLSARNEERLEALAGELVQYLERGAPEPLAGIAYTLQIGRLAMKKRLALLVETHAELLEGLRAYLGREGAAPHARTFSNTRGVGKGVRADDESAQLAHWMAGRQWENLARHWVGGGEVDWRELYDEGARPQKLSLPGYPFEQTRYWPAVPSVVPADGDESAPRELEPPPAPAFTADALASAELLAEALVPVVAHTLGVAPDALELDGPLAAWGLDSLSGLALLQTLRAWLGHDIGAQCVAEGETIRALARNIYEQVRVPGELRGTNGKAVEPRADEYLPLLTEPPARMTPRLIELDGGARAEVFTGGRGRPLVLVPGIGMAGSVFQEQCAFFAAHYSVIVYHYPGLGRSDAPAFPSLEAVAAHLCETVSGVTREPAALLGWSFGGMLAQLAMLKCPERWRSLVLVNTFGSTREVEQPRAEPVGGQALLTLYEDDLEAVLSNGGDPSLEKERERILKLLRQSRALSPMYAIGYLDALGRFDVAPDLPSIARPTLVVTGGKDRFNRLGHSQQLATLIPGAEFLEIAEAGHAPFITHPREFDEAVLAFLRRAEANPHALSQQEPALGVTNARG